MSGEVFIYDRIFCYCANSRCWSCLNPDKLTNWKEWLERKSGIEESSKEASTEEMSLFTVFMRNLVHSDFDVSFEDSSQLFTISEKRLSPFFLQYCFFPGLMQTICKQKRTPLHLSLTLLSYGWVPNVCYEIKLKQVLIPVFPFFILLVIVYEIFLKLRVVCHIRTPPRAIRAPPPFPSIPEAGVTSAIYFIFKGELLS